MRRRYHYRHRILPIGPSLRVLCIAYFAIRIVAAVASFTVAAFKLSKRATLGCVMLARGLFTLANPKR